jgi:hypothetical protein
MTFVKDIRIRLLGAKRVLGNIRNSVVAISDAIACNLADGIFRLSVVSIIPLTPAEALLARVRKGSVPFPIKPSLLGKPLPGRRQPVKAVSREAGARNAPALTG